MAASAYDSTGAEAIDAAPAGDRRRRVSLGPFGGALALGVIGLGLVAIGLGWNGAAGSGGEINHLPNLNAQLPWLLSGGFLGLALVLLGVGLMITQSHRTDRAQLEARLVELIDATRAGGETGRPAAPADLRELVVAGSASYHSPQCRLVDGRQGADYLTPAEAQSRGLSPCRICRPAGSNVSVRR